MLQTQKETRPEKGSWDSTPGPAFVLLGDIGQEVNSLSLGFVIGKIGELDSLISRSLSSLIGRDFETL